MRVEYMTGGPCAKASLDEEPGAGKLHAGICAGGARQRASLPRYSPELGRWPSRDPIGEWREANIYSYAYNDVANSIDILGLLTETFAVGVLRCTHVVSAIDIHGSVEAKEPMSVVVGISTEPELNFARIDWEKAASVRVTGSSDACHQQVSVSGHTDFDKYRPRRGQSYLQYSAFSKRALIVSGCECCKSKKLRVSWTEKICYGNPTTERRYDVQSIVSGVPGVVPLKKFGANVVGCETASGTKDVSCSSGSMSFQVEASGAWMIGGSDHIHAWSDTFISVQCAP